jgi:hypothetical protein
MYQQWNNEDLRTIFLTMARPLINEKLLQHANIGGPVLVTPGVYAQRACGTPFIRLR